MLPIELRGAAGVYLCAVAVLLGASLGSFLNCAAWRISRGESFLRGRSRCPACGHVLGVIDLLPVAGWLLRRGRCHWCGERISPRYVLSELCFALLTLACLLRFGPGFVFLRNLAFLGSLFCLSLVDWERGEIPDGCLAAAALAWAAALPLTGSWRDAMLGLGAGFAYGAALLLLSLAMDRLLGRESLGGGDIKLFAVVGLYLGFAGTLFALLLSCVLGLALAALLRRGAGRPFPFGPAISAAAAGMLLFGGGLTDWYLGLLGLA